MGFISNKNNNIKTFSFFLLFCILNIFFHVVGHTTTVFLSSAMSEVQSILSQRLVFGSDVVSHTPLYPPNLTLRLIGEHCLRGFAGFRASASKKQCISIV